MERALLVAPTVMEILPFTRKYDLNIPGTGLYETSDLHTPDILVTGVGIMATTYHLQKALQQNKYKNVLHAGIAGSFSENLKPGDLINICQDRPGDTGAEDHDCFLDLYDLDLSSPDEAPYIDGWLINPNFSEKIPKLKKVKGITVNKTHGAANTIDQVVSKYNPDVETMESAAVFYICLMEKIPFQCIRAISNYVEPRNRDKWEIELAVERLNDLLLQI